MVDGSSGSDDLYREVYRTHGKLTSCFDSDAMERKAWQFAYTLPAEKLSQVHNPGINTSLLVEHAYGVTSTTRPRSQRPLAQP